MDNQLVEKIKIKQKYNKLLFKITQYNLRSSKPHEKLIEEAKELGRHLDLSVAELKNIEFTTF